MAGLDVLGGIGSGLMQGSRFIQQKQAQDEQLALQRQQADQTQHWREQQATRLDEQQTWQRQDRAQAEEARQKTAAYEQLFAQTAAELGDDATPEQLGAEVLKRGLRSGQIPQREVAPLLQQAAKLRKLGVTAAFRRGDVGELGRIMSGPQQYGRPVRMELAKGADEFGQPSDRYRVIDEADGSTLADFSPLQLGSILGADDLLDEYEQQTKIRKTHSEITENQAQTRAADALAQQRRTSPTGGQSAAVDPTKGFSAATREEATRAALARKVASGTATPEERDLFGVLQNRAAAQPEGYVPPEAKKVAFWRDAPPEQVAAEVERQIATMRTRAAGDPYLAQQLRDPAVLEALRTDIVAKLGAQPTGSAELVTGQRPGQAPQATNANGTPSTAPGQRRPLDAFFR